PPWVQLRRAAARRALTDRREKDLLDHPRTAAHVPSWRFDGSGPPTRRRRERAQSGEDERAHQGHDGREADQGGLVTESGEARPSGGEPIRVLIVDDHELIRRSLALALAAEPDIEVVGEASDGHEAVELADRLMPAVALMDVRMPKPDGIEATQGIKSSVPSTRIIMLTVSDEEEDLFEAIKAGATGYLLKDVQINDVPAAVRGVHEGQSLI